MRIILIPCPHCRNDQVFVKTNCSKVVAEYFRYGKSITDQELGKAMLERLGYRVTTRTNSIETQTTFQNQPEAIDLKFAIQAMPGINLSRHILKIHTNLQNIFYTGYCNNNTEMQSYSFAIKGLATKRLLYASPDVPGRC